MKTTFYFVTICCSFLLIACTEKEQEPTPFYHIEKLDFDHGLFNYNTIIRSEDAHSGKSFSRADIGNNFGIGYSVLIPDSLKGDSIFASVTAWVRTGDITNNNDIILSITSNDSIIAWFNCNAKEFIKKPNEWTEIQRNFALPIEKTSLNNVYVNVMGHNIDAKAYFDIDDLEFKINN